MTVTSPATNAAATPDTSPSTEPAAFEVSLAGRAFNPAVLEVTVGDTVTWINDDDTEHTVSAFEGAFDSGELAEGASFSFTFDSLGNTATAAYFTRRCRERSSCANCHGKVDAVLHRCFSSQRRRSVAGFGVPEGAWHHRGVEALGLISLLNRSHWT